jgi:putative photosynthetic complex assembly protein
VTESVNLRPFPRAPLVGAAVMICGTFAFALAARLFDVGTTHIEYTKPLASRDLRFEDRADGSVAVLDAKDGGLVELMTPGTNGFVRIVMRGLARDRMNLGIGAQTPFELTRWEDGRLTISDPETGHRTELVGFGTTNVEAFAKLLLAGSNAP